jgi:hypothetical protein
MAGVISLSVALTRTLAVGEANRKAFLASEHSTTTMKGYIVGLAAALTTCVAIAIVMMGAPGEVEGSIIYVKDPWIVNETTTLSNGTWQVNGSLTVDACTLTLQDATLIMAGGWSSNTFMVNAGAWFVSIHSNLTGRPNRWAYAALYGDVVLDNTTVKAFETIEQPTGSLVVDHCTFSECGTHISSYSNLKVRSTVFRSASYSCINWYPRSSGGPKTISIEGSSFNGSGGYTEYGIRIEGSYYDAPVCRAVVRGCEFVDINSAVFIYNLYSSTILVERNSCERCEQGLYIDHVGKTLYIHNNDWSVEPGGYGVHISDVTSLSHPLIRDETITGGDEGIYMYDINAPTDIENVTVVGADYGIYISYGTLNVHNSTVNGNRYDFYVGGAGYIHLFNTTHNYRGYVSDYYYDEGFIEETRRLGIEAAIWQSGVRIIAGRTELVNETGFPLTSFSNERPTAVDVPVWRVMSDRTILASTMRGAYSDRGTRFFSRPIPIKETDALSITIIDDVLPWAKVTKPMPGDKFKDPAFKVEGLCDDLGSGLFKVQLRYGDEPWRDAQFDNAGVWSVTLAGVQDDTADVVVRVSDLAGNINETVLEDITVDTMIPSITLVSPKAPVNHSPATLVAMTEPHARAFVNSVEVPVADNGAIVASVELLEGVNHVMVSVVDRVGNKASVDLVLTLDTIPPTLRLDSPAEGAWFRTEFVKVIGLVSEGVTITASGETFYADEGMFESTVTLKEELTLVVVTAVDGAGNVASESRLVHLDTAKPRLTVAYPLSGSYLTTPHALVRGKVRDEGPVGVTVGAWTAEVSGEQWSCEVGLVEGRNSINVVATDAAGNVDSTYLDLNLDTTPPQAVVRLLVNGQSVDPTMSSVNTRATSLSLEVSLTEDCVVDMNVDGPSSLPAGMSNLTLKLQEGLNDVLIELRDLAGNRGAPVRFQVFVDTVRPVLELERAGQVRTRDPDLVVSGSTEPGCQVMVDGVAVGLLNDNTFSTVVHLNEGSNLIEITSVDAAGNSAYKNLVVDLETVKVGTSPFEGTAGGIAIGLVIGILVALGAFGWRTRRRPVAHVAAEEPSVAPTDDTPSGRTEGEREVAEPRAREDVVYPRAGVVRRRGR